MDKTLVELFMEEQGLPMPPKFKRQSTKDYILWRQGKVESKEFEGEPKWLK